MKSIFRAVRREDRILPQGEALELLRDGEYGFLALSSAIPQQDGAEQVYGYGVPLNYLYLPPAAGSDGKGEVWFHCAPEGQKLDALKRNPRVSFCVVGPTQVQPYTTAYESVHLFGRIGIVEDEALRLRALRGLRDKYNPELSDAPEKYIMGSLHRTVVLCLEIEHVAGKCKR